MGACGSKPAKKGDDDDDSVLSSEGTKGQDSFIARVRGMSSVDGTPADRRRSTIFLPGSLNRMGSSLPSVAGGSERRFSIPFLLGGSSPPYVPAGPVDEEAAEEESFKRPVDDEATPAEEPSHPALARARLVYEQLLFLADYGLHIYLIVAFLLHAQLVPAAVLGGLVLLQLGLTYALLVRHVARIRGKSTPMCGRGRRGRMHCLGAELSWARRERSRGWSDLSAFVLAGPLIVPLLDLLLPVRTLTAHRLARLDLRPDLEAFLAAYRTSRYAVHALFQALPGLVVVAIVLAADRAAAAAAAAGGGAADEAAPANATDVADDSAAVATRAGSDSSRLLGEAGGGGGGGSGVLWGLLATSLALSALSVLQHLLRQAYRALKARRPLWRFAFELAGDPPLDETRLGLVRAIALRDVPVGAGLDALVAALAAGGTVGEVIVAGKHPLLVGSWPPAPSVADARILAAMLRRDETVRALDAVRRHLTPAHGAPLAEALKTNRFLHELYLRANALGDEGVLDFAAALDENNTLRVLDLSENVVADEGASALAEAFTRSPGELRALGLRRNQITDKGATAIGRFMRAPACRLRSLRLDRNSIGDEGAAHIAGAIKGGCGLRELRLDGNTPCGDRGVIALADALEARGVSLERLDISATGVRAAGARRIAESLERNKSLLSLKMGVNQVGNGGVADAFMRALERSTTLTELDVALCQLPFVDVSTLARALQENRSVRQLDISGNLADDSFAEQLNEALALNNTLRVLHAGQCNLFDDAAFAIASGMRAHGSLRELHISGNRISAAGVDALAEALKMDHGLRALYLDANRVGDDGLRSLAAALSFNDALLELSVRANRITDVGALALAASLGSENRTLQELDLGSNKVAEAGAEAFARALRTNTTLTTLSLDRNRVGEQGAVALAGMLRDTFALRVLRVDSPNLTQQATDELAHAVRRRRALAFVDAVHDRPGAEGEGAALATALRTSRSLRALLVRAAPDDALPTATDQ